VARVSTDTPGVDHYIMKERIKAGLMALVLSMSLAVSAVAGPLEDGMDAYKREDYATALRLLRPLAEQGNPAAMNQLGTMFVNGFGVPKDFAEALKWWRTAAEQGSTAAMFNLAVRLEDGKGVPQDYVEALKWYRKLAEQSDEFATLATSGLARMFYSGEHVPQDYAEAVKWWRKAAEQGDLSAMFNLALRLEDGKGVPQDYAEAVKWRRKRLNKATRQPCSGSGSCTTMEREYRRTIPRR